MRQGGRRRLSCVALTAALFACDVGRPAAAPPDLVVARLAAAPGPRAVAARPAVEIRTTKLATRTRNAVTATTEGFEVRVPGSARRLAWSTAWPGDPGSTSTRLGIEIRTRPDGAWSPLAAREVSAGAGWTDHEAPLPAPGAERVLRFRASGEASGTSAAWGSILFLGPPDAEARAPNIVVISLDTLGAAPLGTFDGPPGISPRIDHFLAQSASFRRAYAPYGNTLVSHSSLFSALHPRRHGVYGGQIPGPLAVSLIPRLAAAGYRSVAFTEGAFVSAAFGFSVGFDAYDDGSLGLESQMAGGAAQTFARAGEWLERNAGDRFFLFVHTYEVHAPYLPRDASALAVAAQLTPGDERVFSREEQGGLILAHNRGDRVMSPEVLARLAALHAAEVHTLDTIVGDFLDRLEAAGLANETLVVLTADHADQFGEAGKVGHGDSLHNRVLHVPLGFRWPRGVVARDIATPVALIDVLPTVLELAGLPVPTDLDGRSLAEPLRRATPVEMRPVFSEQRSSPGECTRLGLARDCRLDRIAVQTERFKLEQSRRPPYARLYDLAADPHEAADVSGEHAAMAQRLGSLIETYRNDPGAEAEAPPQEDLDSDTRGRLRDLGYGE